MNPYLSEVEQQMQRLYHSLSEKDRRRYAAIEAPAKTLPQRRPPVKPKDVARHRQPRNTGG